MHAHLIQWYTLEIDGKPVYEEYPELWNVPKDTFQIGGGRGQLTVVARYGPSMGRYLVRYASMHLNTGIERDCACFAVVQCLPPLQACTCSHGLMVVAGLCICRGACIACSACIPHAFSCGLALGYLLCTCPLQWHVLRSYHKHVQRCKQC